MLFRRMFFSDGHDRTARQVYELIMAKARQRALYEHLYVADTVEGRFDMLVLFAVLLMRRLSTGPHAARHLGQAIFDHLFRDMDRALRQQGVGDLSVGKRVRRLAEIFYGRAAAYRAALADGSEEELRCALERNVYPRGVEDRVIRELTGYVAKCAAILDRQDMSDLVSGRVLFPDYPLTPAKR
jgi:cytochrome b pre-mRNA-processing protein 3